MSYAQIILACLIVFGWSRILMPSPNATVSMMNARIQAGCNIVGFASLAIAGVVLGEWVGHEMR